MASLQGEEPGFRANGSLALKPVRDTRRRRALHVDADEPGQAEVGFTLARAQQGKGYATEALTGLLDWAFPTFKLHRVIAITDALNSSAAALLERVGFRREAHFVENVFFKGAWGSEFSFAVLAHEWAARRA